LTDRPGSAIPDWFSNAINHQPVRASFVVSGASIELLTWGERGKPGLLFLHGSGAHADWWSFIAPFFADRWRVAAISWSGMGRSQWRDAYSLPLYAEEIWGAIEAADLEASGHKPVVVAHSFGGLPALQAGVQHPERLRGLVFLDCRLRSRALLQSAEHKRPRIFPNQEAILPRFQFLPPELGLHPFIRDFIAGHSIKHVDTPQAGWTWCFDPARREKLEQPKQHFSIAQLEVPTLIVAGERSTVVTGETLRQFQQAAPHIPQVLIQNAGHHLMVDQPLALIAALQATFAVWKI
jgi:pimeloyl-ACP methyl ester carboxylesterase